MDTLPFAKKLQGAGIKPEHAEAIATGSKEFMEEGMSSYVKETDLEVILLRFKTDIIEAIDSRVDALETKIDGKIDALETKIDGKIDALDTKIDGKIDRLDTKLSNRIFQLYVLVTAVGTGVVGALYWILKDAGLV